MMNNIKLVFFSFFGMESQIDFAPFKYTKKMKTKIQKSKDNTYIVHESLT